jgi:hypothetical protein
MSGMEKFIFPLPGCSRQESRLLRQLISWTDEYLREKEKAKPYARLEPPTTLRCTALLKIQHWETLRLLNRLERQGLVSKYRRRSAGMTGFGYDGSLHSEVWPSQKIRDLVALADGKLA